jgi:excisionase family DNA binding protein
VSLVAQEAKIDASATVKDRTLLEIVRDEGVSAKSLTRPGLERLLALVGAGEVDVVIVYKLDRLTRSVVDLGKLMKLFERRHVALVSLQESLGATTAADSPENRAADRKEGRLMTNQQLLTPEQVAERLQISRWTVMDYLRAGKLKGYKVGRLWRIKEQDLEDFLEGEPTEEDLEDAKALDDALADPRRYDYRQTRRELGL